MPKLCHTPDLGAKPKKKHFHKRSKWALLSIFLASSLVVNSSTYICAEGGKKKNKAETTEETVDMTEEEIITEEEEKNESQGESGSDNNSEESPENNNQQPESELESEQEPENESENENQSESENESESEQESEIEVHSGGESESGNDSETENESESENESGSSSNESDNQESNSQESVIDLTGNDSENEGGDDNSGNDSENAGNQEDSGNDTGDSGEENKQDDGGNENPPDDTNQNQNQDIPDEPSVIDLTDGNKSEEKSEIDLTDGNKTDDKSSENEDKTKEETNDTTETESNVETDETVFPSEEPVEENEKNEENKEEPEVKGEDSEEKEEKEEKDETSDKDGDEPCQDPSKEDEGEKTDKDKEETNKEDSSKTKDETEEDEEVDIDITKEDEPEEIDITAYNPDVDEIDIVRRSIEIAKPEIGNEDVNLTPENSSSSNSGYTYTGTYYNGNNTYYPYYQYSPTQMSREEWIQSLTPYERLIVDMTRTEKIPAIATEDVNVREGRGEDFRIVGFLPEGGVCYIIEDGGDWLYIESGEVRGFVPKYSLLQGAEAVKTVEDVGETSLVLAETKIDPSENAAFDYLPLTTSVIPEMPSYSTSGYGVVNRADVVSYAMQFIGRPYAAGGEDLWNGTDASGFTKGVYSHFGIVLPKDLKEQCYAGERIDAESVRPGDLLFYSQGGNVYHVMIYIGNGQAVQSLEEKAGVVIADVDYNLACWGCRVIQSSTYSSTQASDLVSEGRKAAAGDEVARETIVDALAAASEDEWNTYGFPRSVLIAQTIQESNWLSFQTESAGGISPDDNNILGMNAELSNDDWESPWTGSSAERVVPQLESGELIYGNEMMRTYDDIESCMNDYAAFKIARHPDLKNITDVDIVIEEGLLGFATDPDYQSSIKHIIEKYDLTKYDTVPEVTTGNVNGINYSQEQLELIWAIVAQEDDTSYEGALAVITTAMNRADQNYGGHGTDALSQLTADGQFCYSPSVSDPIYYQRRLGGNVPEYVKQAVSDCFGGRRNHIYLNFRSSNRTGNYVQIGSNWYF